MADKTIFDDKFLYLSIPVEVLKTPGLNSDERIILARVIYWTRKGLPCTQTNEEFGELIGRSDSTAKRCVHKLVRLGLADAYYLNNKRLRLKGAYRDLTALVGVDDGMINKRKAVQLTRATAQKLVTGDQVSTEKLVTDAPPPGHERPGISRKAGQLRPGTTMLNKNKRATPQPQPFGGQSEASPPDEDDCPTMTQQERDTILAETPWGRQVLAERKRQAESKLVGAVG